ncbi:hypothetical protein Tco_0134857 [Tanacetum coccineum]
MIRILAGQLYMVAAMAYASSLSIMSLRVIGYVKVGLHAYVLENACRVEIMRILAGLSFYFAEIGRMAESDIHSPQQPPQTHIDYGFRTMVVCTVIGCDDGDRLLQVEIVHDLMGRLDSELFQTKVGIASFFIVVCSYTLEFRYGIWL